MLGGVRTKSWQQSVINLLSSPLMFAIAATGVGEWLLYTNHVGFALWGHLVALFACLVAPLVNDDDGLAVRSFVLVPLFRLVNLGMPVFVEITLYWLPLVYGSLFPSIYVLATAADTPRLRWNFRRGLALVPPSVLVGAVAGRVEYTLLEPAALVPSLTPTNVVVLGVVMFGFVALGEEVIFRGLVQPTLGDRLGLWPGLVVTNLLFGAMHSAYPSPTTIGFVTLLGVLFSLTYEATDSLLVPTTIHGTANVVLFGIAPLHGSLLPAL